MSVRVESDALWEDSSTEQKSSGDILVGQSTEWVRLSDIIVLQQIRQVFDAEDLEELADKMVVKGVADDNHTIDLIHAPTVGKFDDVGFKQYLLDHGLYYNIQHTVDDYQSAYDGFYYVMIAGERRKRALSIVCDRLDLDVDRVFIPAVERDDISFDFALSLQSRENTYRRPDPVEDAISIERHFNYIIHKHHKIPTNVEIARHFGFSAEKVSDALTYQRLPEKIREEVANKYVTYGQAILLSKLYESFIGYLPIKYPLVYSNAPKGSLRQGAEDSVMAIVAHLKTENMQRMSSTSRSEYIHARIAEIRNTKQYQDIALFFYDQAEELPRAKRNRAEGKMGAFAAKLVVERMTSGAKLSPEEVLQLRVLQGILAASTDLMDTDVVPDNQDSLFEVQ